MAPAAEVDLAGIVVSFAALCVLIVAWGLANMVDTFVKAILGTVGGIAGKIPFIGGVVSAPIRAAESRLTQAMGAAIGGVEAAMGKMFHVLAFEVSWLGRTIQQTAETVFALAAAVASLTHPAEVKKLWQSLVGHEQATLGRVKQAQQTASQALSRTRVNVRGQAQAAAREAVAPVEGELSRVQHVLSGRIGALESEVAGTLEPEIAGLRERTRAIEDAAVRAYEWARGFWKVASVGAAAAVVAVALGRLNLAWIRCRNVETAGRRLCGLDPSLLEALLAGTLVLASGFSIVQLAEETLSIEEELVGLIGKGVTELRPFV